MSMGTQYRPGPAYLRAVQNLADNPEQRAAFDSRGHCVVLAGPGSGKTTTLAVKLARMLAEDIRAPHRIACISFSNECVRALRQKLEALGVHEGHQLVLGTMHRFCLQEILRPFGRLAGIPVTRTLSPATETEQGTWRRDALNVVYGRSWPYKPAPLISRHRRDVALGRPLQGADPRVVQVVREYEQRLWQQSRVDPDGMVCWGLRLVRRHEWVRRAIAARFPIIVVDEYQDFGDELHELVLCLLGTGEVRLLAVGDPDQSIYGFQGATPDHLLSLATLATVERVQLRFNYRCGGSIIQAAEAALGEARGYEAKSARLGTVDTHAVEGGLAAAAARICTAIVPAALARAEGRPLGEIAILYTNRSDGDTVAEAAQAAGLPVQRVDGGAVYRKAPLTRWLEDAASWCAGGWRTGNPSLASILRQWRHFAPTGLAEDVHTRRTLTLVRVLSGARQPDILVRDWLLMLATECLQEDFRREELTDERELFRQLFRLTAPGERMAGMTLREFGGQRGSPDHLNLITLHSAKGLEFDVVIILGVNEGRFPDSRVTDDRGLREARRLFYVGLTRARHEVHLTYSTTEPATVGAPRLLTRSRFLDEVLGRLGH